MDGPTNMDPSLTGISIIGQGGYRNISGGSHTQSIVEGGESIICSDIITHVMKNSGEVTLESNSFTFNPLKVETLMVSPLVEPFLASDGDVRLKSIIGASRPDQSRIVAPGMNKPIKGPHLVNRVFHSMDGPTNMNPVLTDVGIIGQGESRTISGGINNQSIVQGGGKHNSQQRHNSCPDEL